MATNAPFPGVIRPGAKGVPVAVIQRTLKNKLGYERVVPKGVWGANTTRALIDFQKRQGLSGTGNYGLKTHQKLKGHMSEPDRALMRTYVARQAAQKAAAARSGKVSRIVYAATVMIGREPYIHYTQGALRMSAVNRKQTPYSVTYGDCSSLATYLYWYAGLPDPNGRGYDGYGYTGTLAAHGHVVATHEAAPGDLVFYGVGFPWSHVAVVIGGIGWQATCFSHGSESGPKHVEIAYRAVGQVRRYF